MIININREYFSNYILDIIFVNFNTSVYYLTNGAVANGEITNYAIEGTIRVDLTFGIGYGDSIEQAKRILYDLMKKQEKNPWLSRRICGRSWTGGFLRKFGRKALYKTAKLIGRLFLPL